MKSKSNWQTSAIENHRVVLLVLALTALLLSVFFLFNISDALAAAPAMGPECVGCHENTTPGASPLCGTCHGSENITQGNGAHPTHLNAASGKGPSSVVCSTCHGTGTDGSPPAYYDDPRHRNGVVNFGNSSDTLSNTTACNGCHSSGGAYNGINSTDSGGGMSIGAKDNWKQNEPGSLIYASPSVLMPGKDKWCAGCHDDMPPTIGTQQAKKITGDVTTGVSANGFYKAGHGLPGNPTKYDQWTNGDAAGNWGANKGCTACHDPSRDHINDADDSSTIGQRIKSEINGLGVASLQDVCKNCHQVTTGTEGVTQASNRVSTHGNATSTVEGYQNAIEAPFTVECLNCHDPHAYVKNSSSSKNLKMIRPNVKINDTTFGQVVFISRTGADSFDESEAGDVSTNSPNPQNVDDVCVTCHSNNQNPGYPTQMHAGAWGHESPNDNQQGNACPDCHNHNGNGDTNYLTADGFKPAMGEAAACNTCHTAFYSNMKNGSHETHLKMPDDADQRSYRQSLKGPGLMVCITCHPGPEGDLHEGHRSGRRDFGMKGNPDTSVTLAQTDVCDGCHSNPAMAKAKWNFPDTTWAIPGPPYTNAAEPSQYWFKSGIYEDTITVLGTGKDKWCVTCHKTVTPSVVDTGYYVENTSRTAPNAGGDESQTGAAAYGSFINGHSATGTTYDETAAGDAGSVGSSGNAKAAKACSVCHDLTTRHLNIKDGTDIVSDDTSGSNGQRLRDSINGTPTVTVDGVCDACHQNSGGADNQVSDHGNTGEGYVKIEPADFQVGCGRCHEAHGTNKNSNNKRNLKMVRTAVKDTASTSVPVAYESRTATRSLDSTQTPTTAVCRVCHITMQRNQGGDHTTTVPGSIFENNTAGANKRGQDCTDCHGHDYTSNDVSNTVDASNAFMPSFNSLSFPTDVSCDGGCHYSTRLSSGNMNGKHEIHLSTTSNRGPRIGTCEVCHGIGSGAGIGTHVGHMNGKKNLDGSADTTLGTVGMNACNSCHSPGGAYDGVKDTTYGIGAARNNNWSKDTTIYETNGTSLTVGRQMWCVGCHDTGASIIKNSDITSGTTQTAIPVGGDPRLAGGAAYGAYANGHSATNTAAKYDETATGEGSPGGNTKANQPCQTCHDLNKGHITNWDETDTQGQRINGSINGQGVTSVSGACKACHQSAGGATNKVSDHGNSSGSGENYSKIETTTISPVLECANCHENHGNNISGGNRNLKMVSTKVLKSDGTSAPVDYESRTATRSLDSTQTPSTAVCRVCHVGTMLYSTGGGDHTSTVVGRVFEGNPSADKRGGDCTGCHEHNYKGNNTTSTVANAFMPGFVVGGTCDGGCHNALPSTVVTGKHREHLSTAFNRGPQIANCSGCHPDGSQDGTHTTHFNGDKNFRTNDATLGATTACTGCHNASGAYNGLDNSTWTVGARNNWNTTIYETTITLANGKEMWCVTCHKEGGPTINTSATGNNPMTAQAVGGNPGLSGKQAYGAFLSGHSATGTAKYDSGNDRAGKGCNICHKFSLGHMSGLDDTDRAGQSIDTTINGQPVTTVLDACKACHQKTGGTAANKNQVSGHGNTSTAVEGYKRIETSTSPFSIGCPNCHESHGNNKNTGNNRNLQMIRNKVKVTDSVSASVVFEATTGVDSYDSTDASPTNNICVVCHVNNASQGSPIKRHEGGDHIANNETSSIFYNYPAGKDKRNENCTLCHKHDYKSATVTIDNAFMPAFSTMTVSGGYTCSSTKCHGSLANDQTSGRHSIHLLDSTKGPAATVVCTTCHRNSFGPEAWGDFIGHYNEVKDFQDGNDLTNTTNCNQCHGTSAGYDGVGSATYGAKAVWTSGLSVYSADGTALVSGKEQWCVGCHDIEQPGSTSTPAPAVGGNASTYGAFINGHSATGATPYFEDSGTTTGGNVKANKGCTLCHNVMAKHINGYNDTSMAGQRIQTTINNRTGLTTAALVCQACHQYETSGTQSATTGNRVSTHGNETSGGYSPTIESTFTVSNCDNCHESHGNNESTTAPTSRPNLKMVRKDVVVTDTPSGTAAVSFLARLGKESFDEIDATDTVADSDDICATCHRTAINGGMLRHAGGLHEGPGSLGADKREIEDCMSGCHKHNYKGDTVTNVNDAFMPQGCNGHHGNPPVPTGTTLQDEEADADYPEGGGAHVRHFRELGYACPTCHETNVGGMTDATAQRSKVNIDFLDSYTFPQGTNINNGGAASETKSSPYATCDVGCHNPKPFRTGSMSAESTTEGLSNADITWAANAVNPDSTKWLICTRCHDSQGKAIDRQLVSTGTAAFTSISGHSKVNTNIRPDCLICHYIVTPTKDTSEHTYNYLQVRYADSTGTPRLWRDANSVPTTDTQFNFCLACHDAGGAPSNWKFSNAGVTDSVDIATSWSTSTPNSDTSAAAHRTGGMSSTGYGCAGTADSTSATGCHGLHGGAKRKILEPTNLSGQDEEDLCMQCHNLTKMPLATPSGTVTAGLITDSMLYSHDDTAGTDRINVASNGLTATSTVGGIFNINTSETNQWFLVRGDSEYNWIRIANVSGNTLTFDTATIYGGTKGWIAGGRSFYIRKTRATHPTGETAGLHNTRKESTSTFSWNTGMGVRHVECEDCHNVHQAGKGLTPRGTGAMSNAAPVNAGVWGIDATYTPVYNKGGALFTGGSGTVTGWNLDSTTPIWNLASASGTYSVDAQGYRIKNNYDRSGRWYTVASVNTSRSVNITPVFKDRYTPAGAVGGTDYVDYTMMASTYTVTSNPTTQAGLCLKCHSYFAYSTQNKTGIDNVPDTPSGMTSITASTFQAVPQTEVGMDFSPNHMAIHPVLARGKNQPLPTENSAWPVYTVGTNATITASSNVVIGNTTTNWLNMSGSGRTTIVPGWKIKVGSSAWYEVARVELNNRIILTTNSTLTANNGAYTLAAGLGNNFVYPYGPWSLIGCSDCHRYDGPDNVAGPHGSNNRWMLVEATSSLSFPFWDGASFNPALSANIGTSYKSMFCLNCHRRDVYGDVGYTAPTNDTYSRVNHPPDGNTSSMGATNVGPRWGNLGTGAAADAIRCMRCHGGETLGGLHGTSAKRSLLTNAGAYNAAAGAQGTSNRGERFLNGAEWSGVTRAVGATGTMCWVRSSGATDEVGLCTKGHAGSEGNAPNYAY